ncbi:MAG: formate dehydrogenase accessory sulfurtransferase FdhD [Armatimonadetes bacterium]|nr:formate dehydrogenase accessory sulfurtransferase FdhD [Armatimonadota bacterium]
MQPRSDIRTVGAVSVRRGSAPEAEPLNVPVESPLAIEVNGIVAVHLMRLPGHDAELALGHCYAERYLGGLDDVATLEVCTEQTGLVRLRTVREVAPRPASVLISACAGGRVPDEADLPAPVPADRWGMDAQRLLGLMGEMQAAQTVYAEARAVHGAAVFARSGELVVVREDVGRHNAVDKAIGLCVYDRHPMDGVLVTTGRASSEMILKASVARTPIVLSRSGPTSLGIELAERLGITLICYARGPRMSVMTHAERVATARG